MALPTSVAKPDNGNVAALANSSNGAFLANYEYGPFGGVIRSTGPMANVNPFRFSTKYNDDGSDLLYYGFRYYSATLGRWIGRDPLGENGGVGLYVFIANDSVRWIPVDRLLGITWGLKLAIAGNNIDSSDSGYIGRQNDPLTKEIMDKMVSSTENFTFGAWCNFDKNRDFRKGIIAAMNEANSPNSAVNYFRMAATACHVKRWIRRTAWQCDQAAAAASPQLAGALTS